MNPIELYRRERQARAERMAQIIAEARVEYQAACAASTGMGPLVILGRRRGLERLSIPETKPCAVCGGMFVRPPNKGNEQWLNRACCSRMCANRHRAKRSA